MPRNLGLQSRTRPLSFELAPFKHFVNQPLVGTLYAPTVVAGYLVGRLNPHGPLRQGKPKIDWTGEASPRQFRVVSGPAPTNRQVKTMWQKNCPVCRKPLEKKHPTETIPCPCGKYVWKG